MAPGERALREGAGDGGEILESLHHAGKLLELPAGEAEALARVVVEPREAEALVGAAEKERTGEAAEDAAAERLLTAEAAEEWVEQLGAEVAVEAAALARGWWDEQFGGHDHEAKNGRNRQRCQLAFQR